MKRVFNKLTVLLLCLIMVFSSVAVAFAADEVGKSGNIVIGSVTATTVTVRWRAVDGVKGYVLYRSTSPDGEWKSVGKTTDRTLTDNKADPGTVYYYAVRAYKLKSGVFGSIDVDSNRIYGEYSKSVKAITDPAKVSGIKATATGASKVTLAWNSAKGAKAYQIYKLDDATGKYKRIANTSKNTYTVKNLSSLTKYSFKIRAYHKLKGVVYGEFSNVFTVETKPADVKNFKIATSTRTSYSLTWTADNALAGYQLSMYYAEEGGSKSYRIIDLSNDESKKLAQQMHPEGAVLEQTATSFSVSKLTKGFSAKYKVRGYILDGDKKIYGAWSEEVVGGTIPETPVNLQLAPNTDNGISITWDYSDHAAGYEVYCREENGDWGPVGITHNNHFSHRNLTEERVYEYKVRPFIGSAENKITGYFGEVKSLKYTPVKDVETVYPEDWDNTGIIGYLYDPKYKCFYSADDPWQRNFGYNELYDDSAKLIAIVIETCRLKFGYDNRRWMIQLWKGNYGFILYGAEIGIYTKPLDRAVEHYDCATDDDMLQMEMTLYEKKKDLLGMTYWDHVFSRPYQKHWWHTGFVLGNMMTDNRYDTDLRLYARITMRDYEMLAECEKAFIEQGFKKTGYLELATKKNAEGNFYTTKGLDIMFFWT